MDQILARIAALLRQYEYITEANLAEWLQQQSIEDLPAVCKLMNNSDWWGEKDSIAAIDLALDGGFNRQAREDGQALRRALIELYEIMKSNGEANSQGELVISQFNKWLTSHM